jgi:hypothetical protein
VLLRPDYSPALSASPFTDAAIDLAPTQCGVYILYCRDQLIYIGAATAGTGIRAELRAHRAGAYGPCTQRSTAFDYELDANPLRAQGQYVLAHMGRNGGRRPPCNRLR